MERKRTRKVSNAKKAAAAALIQSGVPVRRAAEECGIGVGTAYRASQLDLAPEEFEVVKERIQSRLLVASDRFLGHSVKHINKLDPYRAMICAGIAHDHYLRSRQAAAGQGVGSLTQILVLIDQRSRDNGQRPQDVVVTTTDNQPGKLSD